jgi:hypothetical protein
MTANADTEALRGMFREVMRDRAMLDLQHRIEAWLSVCAYALVIMAAPEAAVPDNPHYEEAP